MQGPPLKDRKLLLHFVIEELKALEIYASHRILPIRTLLEHQEEVLLRFVVLLDQELEIIARESEINYKIVREMFELESIKERINLYLKRSTALRERLGRNHCFLEQKIIQLIQRAVRASSMAENINSRLRTYFFLRKSLSENYLNLLQFYFNHRKFPRSLKSERVGKSPKKLLSCESLVIGWNYWVIAYLNVFVSKAAQKSRLRNLPFK